VSQSERKLPRGISLHPNGKFRARMSHDGTQWSLGYFDTLTDARAALAIARGEAARGTFVPPGVSRRAERLARERELIAARYSVRDWAEAWLGILEDAGRRPGTMRAYRSLLDAHILPALGDLPLVALTPADVEQFIAQLRDLPAARHPGARSNGIAAPAARCLRAMLNGAVRAGKLDVSPFRAQVPQDRRVRPGDDSADVATPAQVAALAAAMPPHLAIAVPLAAWCQLRLGEVLGLQRRDLERLDDDGRAVLHVRRQLNSKTSPPTLTDPKSDAGRRSIAVPPFMLAELRAHVAEHAGPGREGFILTPPGGRGTPVSQTTFDRHWRAARAAVGLPRLRFHDLRHTGLTLYAQAGATAAELMHRGGHSSLAIALRYQHATAERDRALAARMAGALDVEPGAYTKSLPQ